MTAWIAPWHLIPMDALHQALRQWLQRSLLRVQAVLAGHCVVLAWRIHPAYALRLMKALALAETTTAVQPVVLRPVQEVKQEIVGLRPFAVKLGTHLRPQLGVLKCREVARPVANIAWELNYGQSGWEDRCAVEIAKAALAIGADRVDDALRKLAGWDCETAAKAEDLVADAEAELHPWPSNERLADGDY